MKNNILASIRNRTTPTITSGIYWNQLLWLISVGNGHWSWLTLADKNLWAAQVRNAGDPVTLDHVWNFYQWWNNYWFPWYLPAGIQPSIPNKSSTKPRAENYWPYYDSNLFVTPPDWVTRESSGNRNLWWWVINTVEAMQWPCSEWYHVPNSTEMTSLVDIMSSFWFTKWTQYAEYIKLPLAGRRSSNNWTVWLQGSVWIYRISTNDWGAYMRNLYMTNSKAYCGQNWTAASWGSIRPFKNIIVVPDNTRTVLYQGTWDAWIFWNEAQWIISLSSDWITWLTIADKNLWATTAYNYWDTLSEANCWWYFQWWNNYMTHFTWYVDGGTSHPINAANYGPYYKSDTYITTQLNDKYWEASDNRNLWWGIVDRPIARKGPCPDWWHVPSWAELQGIFEYLWVEFSGGTYSGATIPVWEWIEIRNAFKLPSTWFLDNRWEWEYYGNVDSVLLRSSDFSCWLYMSISWRCYVTVQYQYAWNNQYWFPIRPFKNEPVVPDSTRTKLF